VFNAAGQPVAAIGVCINREQVDTEHGRRQTDAVMQAARLLSQRLGAASAGVTASKATA
jgi:DNA-binding IclR family transcriptional regulator